MDRVVSPEGRDTRYDSIPSAIASQIVVRKAVTPDMTGETVAGNVDIAQGQAGRSGETLKQITAETHRLSGEAAELRAALARFVV